MSKSRVWQSAVTLLVATAVSLSLSVGCSKQGEGERCDYPKAGDSDCDDGLFCVNVDKQDRCCPPQGAAISDSRCQGQITSGSGGTSSTGGTSSAGGTGNASGGTNNASGGTADAGAAAVTGGQSSGAGADGI